MISTKDLSGLPNAERLKNFCKGLAALDIIMVEEEWSFIRHYTYNPAWRKGKEAFFATDGSDQSMIVMFAPEGCVINGVDSELYDWEKKLPRIEDLTDILNVMPLTELTDSLTSFTDREPSKIYTKIDRLW